LLGKLRGGYSTYHALFGKANAEKSNDLLCGERPADNPVAKHYLEGIVALETENRLVTDLWRESRTGVNVDFLLRFTA
jgi:hypothetical protein